MRFTFSVFSFVLLLGFQACKNDAANQQTASESGKLPETGKVDAVQPDNASDVVVIMSAEDFDQYIKSNPNMPLIDLRPAEEFDRSHIPHAINIPFVLEGFEDKIKHLKGANEVAIYCANGIRSKRAALALEKFQIKKIRMMDKGIYTWTVAHKMQVREKPVKKK